MDQHKPHAEPDPSLDPHGEHADHHGHVILPTRLLLSVLAALLALTVLTVAFSRAEIIFADIFQVDVPHWINVAVAMSIATVKAVLVVLIFMQLKYDNKLNAVILISSLFVLFLFISISMLDLGTRDSIHDWESPHIQPGGSGDRTRVTMVLDPETGQWRRGTESFTGPIVQAARDRYIEIHGLEKWEEKFSEKKPYLVPEPQVSDAQRSRPSEGVLEHILRDEP
jgi:caa(3)-type oxidase subunit IV